MSSDQRPPSDLGDYLAAGDDVTAGSDLDDSLVDIGRRITEARKAAGMTAAELGAQLGVVEDTVLAWESGDLAARSNLLQRATGVLGVSLSWLMMGHGVGPPDAEPLRLQELHQALLDVGAQLTALSRDVARMADEVAAVAS